MIRYSKNQIIDVLAHDYANKREINQEVMCDILTDLTLTLKNGDHILDLGCGSGRFLLPLAKLFPESKFTGLDISQFMLDNFKLEVKKQKLENVNLIQGDFNDNNWDKSFVRKFNSVLIFQGIHFVENYSDFLARVSNLLVEDGSVIIASTTHKQFYELPYCMAFKTVLKKELSRTPDKGYIFGQMFRLGFSIKSSIDIEVKKKFFSETELKNWLLKKPFSVLSYLSDEKFNLGVEKFLRNYYGKEILIDKFFLTTFHKDCK